MKKLFYHLCLLLTFCVISLNSKAQSTVITGTVKSSASNEPVQRASVIISGSGVGVVTDENGNFRISVGRQFPVTLVISAINFANKEVLLNNASFVNVSLETSYLVSNVVVSAGTRTPTTILESPVSIETVSRAAIRNVPSPSYYDAIGVLKNTLFANSNIWCRYYLQPIITNILCLCEHVCSHLVKNLPFKRNRFWKDHVKCRNAVACNHNKPVFANGINISDFAAIEICLLREMEN